ncbi:alpha/beta hydrolase [Paenibacillus polysaccharolyticus]|uniref:alpha/beta fold hydrolase n=1 Tax=Paenibacillus polysaccharolyticus TaxID=582692 RepID=UPI00209FBDC2|nr:alpha/beta hydrolase [Paenibacillus polysaccharolyticus]MCP1135851.1 alpha/beta hydrolase [Paenibacillus polysaccharolyticus]
MGINTNGSGFFNRYDEAYYIYGDCKLYCKYSRNGTPSVVFIAGLGDSCETWNLIQDQISEVASTFSYDRAGVGKSEGTSVPRTCKDLVNEMLELLLVHNMKSPFILVGHSFGGLIARLCGSLYPNLVSGIVLVDGVPEYKELAYEKVLTGTLRVSNREYYENPLLNHELIDKVASYEQITQHSQLYDIPLSIITRGLPDRMEDTWPAQAILEIEQKLQFDFQKLSTSSRHRIACCSGHNIHHDEPEIVIEEIMGILKEMKK